MYSTCPLTTSHERVFARRYTTERISNSFALIVLRMDQMSRNVRYVVSMSVSCRENLESFVLRTVPDEASFSSMGMKPLFPKIRIRHTCLLLLFVRAGWREGRFYFICIPLIIIIIISSLTERFSLIACTLVMITYILRILTHIIVQLPSLTPTLT